MAPWIVKPAFQLACKILKKRVGGGYFANITLLLVAIATGFSGGYYGHHILELLWKYRKPLMEEIGRRIQRDSPGTTSPGFPDRPGPATSSSIAVYFTQPGEKAMQPGNIAQKLAGYIDQTRETLDVCAFELDNVVIVDALVRAVGRGVRVRRPGRAIISDQRQHRPARVGTGRRRWDESR